jgi:hypothetical protein
MDKFCFNYYGLIFKCPVDIELKGCAFNKIRDLPSKQRMIYYNALTEKEKNILIANHQNCLSLREEKKLFQNTK